MTIRDMSYERTDGPVLIEEKKLFLLIGLFMKVSSPPNFYTFFKYLSLPLTKGRKRNVTNSPSP